MFDRPVLIYGAGIHLAHAEQEAVDYARALNIPVAPTWAALDLFPSDDPLIIGSFGTHGTRAGNFAVQNASRITAIGTRLDSKATGTPIESFARAAKVFMVDIDKREIDKFKPFNGRITGVPEDAKSFLQKNIPHASYQREEYKEWFARINQWKKDYPVSEEGPYGIIKEISNQAQEGEIICTDTGCAVAWVSQAWRWKRGQRFIHSFNQTPMGYGLPAALGAHYATDKRVILITGDGSLMMSIGELATIQNLPIKIFLLNNKGHAMCRQTQREWFGEKYPSTSIEGGLKFPHFRDVAGACGIHGWVWEGEHEERISLEETIHYVLRDKGPSILEIKVDPEADVVPKVKYGHPNEDGHPLLKNLEKEMLIPLWTV